MRTEVILTTMEDGQLVEQVVGHTTVTIKTDLYARMYELATKHFKGGKFHMWKDQCILRRAARADGAGRGVIAVNERGDTLHLRGVWRINQN